MHPTEAPPVARSIVSPEDQRVTFVELFFDLVFVFCVTQIVGLFHGSLTWTTVGQALLVFWLVWWAWTQYTWALNAADTTHPYVGFSTLIATAIAFFMAVAIPDAFHGGALWFALPYVVVRVFGLTLYAWVAGAASAGQRAAVRRFTIFSIGGLVAVLLGAVMPGPAQYWLWAGAIVLDISAAALGARSESWDLHPEHFAERHGLFVIIALGETLIVAAAGLSDAELSPALVIVSMLAVAITCALWWSYFMRAKPTLDRALEAQRGAALSSMARDVFSLIHFPMLWGVIAYAVAVEAAIEHPTGPFEPGARLALALGVLLFVGGMVLAMWRARRRLLSFRLIIAPLTALAVLAAAGAAAVTVLGIAVAGVVTIVALEQRANTELHR